MQDKSKTHSISKIVGIVGVYAFGFVFILSTNPNNLALPLLVVPFIWLFLVIMLSVYLLLKRKPGMGKRQRLIIAGLIAATPVLLLVFQSIHQLTIRDIILSSGLVLLTAFYMIKADFIK